MLKPLKDQIKANLASVISNLGGGSHGHIELCLSTSEYTTISGMPYICPVSLGVLSNPPRAMAYEPTRLREKRKATITLLREVIDIEIEIVKQIV